MSPRRFVIAVALAASAFVPAAARADTTAAAAARKAATDRYHHGIELYKRATQTHDAADFERAYLEFAQAYSIYPDDKVLWNLAASELETKRFLAALRHFRLYDAHTHTSENGRAPDHAKLASYLDRAYGATGHLNITAPAGAHLVIDGSDVGVAPVSDAVDVEEGTHQVSTDAETKNVEAAGGQLVKVVFAASDNATAAAATTASTATASTATTPATAPTAPASSASSVSEGSAHRGGIPAGAWILGGVGVVAIGVGVGFALDASSKNDTVSSANSSGACVNPNAAICTNAQDAKSTRDRDHVIEGVAFAAGGAALVGGILWTVLDRSSSSDAAFLVPDFGFGRVGLRAQATF